MAPSNSVGLRQIADQAGVSTMTVSLALRNDSSISEATRKRIKVIADQLGYKRDPLLSAYGQHIRRRRTDKYHSTIAWFHDWWKRDDYKQRPFLRRYLQGAQERATALGCAIDPIWLREPQMDARRLHEIMQARGIRAYVLHQVLTPETLDGFPFKEYASVSIGRNFLSDSIPIVLPDATSNALIALQEIVARGYRRIGFFQNFYHMERTQAEGLSTTYFHSHRLTGIAPLKPFLFTGHEHGPEEYRLFGKWFEEHQPDVILTENDDILYFTEANRIRVPEDVGVVHLEATNRQKRWSGIDPLPEALGAAAIDIILGQLFRNEFGAQHPYESLCLIGEWTDGGTCRAPTSDPASTPRNPRDLIHQNWTWPDSRG